MRKKNNRGFTMAEMLIVVAILGVLAGVSFVGVRSHQRSMAQLERDTIAKEIYFAAQNHLTMAESQGYLADNVGTSFYGEDDVSSTPESKTYYVIANGSGSFTGLSMLNLMLPFGAIDETVRAGGSYLIRYQANPAIVLDVFYCNKTGEYNHTISADDYSDLMDYKEDIENHRSTSLGFMVGWYGGAEQVEAGEYLDTPSVKVENTEKLTVTVVDPNKDNPIASLQLLITGVSSNAKAVFMLNSDSSSYRVDDPTEVTIEGKAYKKYVVTLDDISLHTTPTDKGWHFANLATDGNVLTVNGTFTPGEDIVVEAISYSNSSFSNIAESNEVTTNSLFADVVDDPETHTTTAIISNTRHLENLDATLSGLNVALTHAKQIENLDWNGFVTEMGLTVRICNSGSPQAGTKPGCYLPVNLGSGITYDGNNHVISNIVIDNNDSGITIDNGGIFATMATGSYVQNLVIKDISVNLTSGNAGALVGTLTQRTDLGEAFNVSNVVAYHTSDAENKTITAAVNVGGLIGEMTGGKGKVQKSAAALFVSSTGSSNGNAGGLIGKSDTGAVTACYSGGHAAYNNDTGAVEYSDAAFNVIADVNTGNAGGLIGNAAGTTITNCYSTCSATGKVAGGFVGTSSGSIRNCYATGLVGGTTKGAFAGTLTGAAIDCQYFEIINEDATATDGYLPAVSVNAPTTIKPLDANAGSYNEFVGDPENWLPAVPYDTTPTGLIKYYDNKYGLKPINVLDSSVETTDLVATHYGDWPAPEIFVLNTPSS